MAPETPATIDDIPGWFRWTDQRLFEHFLSATDTPGDLLELGAYLGKSAALMGGYLRDGETFTVCDLFGADPADDSNLTENRASYATLDRTAFEANYRAVRGDLPVVVQGVSSMIVDHVRPGSVRFAHVDASHLWEHVRVDIESVRSLAAPGAVAVFDDIRSEHTPGVAAAVWSAVHEGVLHPVCITPKKLYASLDDPEPHRQRLLAFLEEFGRLRFEEQVVESQPLVRIWPPPPARSAPAQPAAGATGEDLRKVARRLRRIESKLDALASRPSIRATVARRWGSRRSATRSDRT